MYIAFTLRGAMWLLVVAAVLQGVFVLERITNRFVLTGVHFWVKDERSATQVYADSAVLTSVYATLAYWVILPFQTVFSFLNLIWQNSVLFIALLLGTAGLLVVSENFERVMLVVVGTYNSGVGLSIDQFLTLFEFVEIFVRIFIPIYNSIVWFLFQVAMQVFLPFFSIPSILSEIPGLAENLSLMVAAFSLSISEWVGNVLFCVGSNTNVARFVASNVTSVVPLVPMDLQCVANTAQYTIDLMTPASYLQQAFVNVQTILVSNCQPVAFIVELLIYPLTDFNLYKMIHCLVNFVTMTFVAVPTITHKRCQWATADTEFFYDEEKAIICLPDFHPWIAVLVEAFRAFGNLIDNFLNVGLAMVERQFGVNQQICRRQQAITSVFTNASTFFVQSTRPVKYVQLTESMYAFTDGLSTLYQTSTDNTFQELAIGNWPFQVDTTFGIAGVKASEAMDTDVQSDSRTGMLGCQCVDEVVHVNGVAMSRMRVLCASVPYQNHHDNTTEYTEAVLHEIEMPSEMVRYEMDCATTNIVVQPLLFSRKRVAEVNVDAPLNDIFDTFNQFGNQQDMSFNADAAIVVQPKCTIDGSQCTESSNRCFPYCLGLHLAGQSGVNISVHNVRHWEENMLVTRTECVGTYLDYDLECNTFGVGSNAGNPGIFSNKEEDICDLTICEQNDESLSLVAFNTLVANNTENEFLKNKTQPGYMQWALLLVMYC